MSPSQPTAEPSLLDELAGITANMIAIAELEREVIRVGPFAAFLHREDPLKWINHAIAVEPNRPSSEYAAGLEQLRQLFATRQRQLRIEYPEAAHPGLDEVLTAAGLITESRQPIMLVTPSELIAPPTARVELRLRLLGTAAQPAELDGYYDVVQEVFDFSASPSMLADTRRLLADGQLWLAVAESSADGRAVGTACLSLVGGFASLAGVATRSAFRRRGVASVVCAWLCQQYFGLGGRAVWLTAGDEPAAEVYHRIGFRRLATLNRVWALLPPDANAES